MKEELTKGLRDYCRENLPYWNGDGEVCYWEDGKEELLGSDPEIHELARYGVVATANSKFYNEEFGKYLSLLEVYIIHCFEGDDEEHDIESTFAWYKRLEDEGGHINGDIRREFMENAEQILINLVRNGVNPRQCLNEYSILQAAEKHNITSVLKQIEVSDEIDKILATL